MVNSSLKIRDTPKVLLAFVRVSFNNAYIYRLDFWVWSLSIVIMMYASYSIWTILYTQSPDAFGMDLVRMTTYGVLGMLLASFVDVARETQWYIANQVREGTLELDLMKPINFLFLMLFRNLGDFCVVLLTRGVPGLVFAVVFLNFRPPANLQAGFGFIISVALGYMVLFAISLLVGMLAIVVLDIRSFGWVFMSVIFFASGQMVPLWMYPPLLKKILEALPFKDIYYTPLALYIDAYPGELYQALLSQAIWALILLAAARLFWVYVQRRITVQGG